MKEFDTENKKGMIHGRFQPFTIGHMQHLKRALKRIEKGNTLFVGITKPFPTDDGLSVGDDHRDNKASNPYSFEERREMVLRSVKNDPEIADRIDDICVIPWSMNNEEERKAVIEAFMPQKDVIQFMNIIPNDGWEYEKEKILKSLGFETVNLVDTKKPRITSATKVRNLRFKGDLDWIKNVPEGTRQVLEEIREGKLQIHQTSSSVEEFLEKIFISSKDVANMTLPRTPDEQKIADKIAGYIARAKDFEKGQSKGE